MNYSASLRGKKCVMQGHEGQHLKIDYDKLMENRKALGFFSMLALFTEYSSWFWNKGASWFHFGPGFTNSIKALHTYQLIGLNKR